jgi:hypothetical protein
MSVPLNKQDYERFLKLAEAIMQHGQGEISIYTGASGYVSLEIKTANLPLPISNEIFGVSKGTVADPARVVGASAAYNFKYAALRVPQNPSLNPRFRQIKTEASIS